MCIYVCVCAPRAHVCCCFVCTRRTNISLKNERVFLRDTKKRQFFARKEKKNVNNNNNNNNTENNFAAKGSPVGGKTLLHARW